ncbi:MAG: hypothetical protein LCH85_22110 [Chloroflexi bacterium]|nr:hypothetical protein [Chloroflexota bacterium]
MNTIIEVIRTHLSTAQSLSDAENSIANQPETLAKLANNPQPQFTPINLNNDLGLRVLETPSPTNPHFCTIYHDDENGETSVVAGVANIFMAASLISHLSLLVAPPAPIAPARPRTKKTTRKIKKPICTCPSCESSDKTGAFYCLTLSEWGVYSAGQLLGYRSTYNEADSLMRQHLYTALTKAAA